MLRLNNQSKLRAARMQVKYKYGVEIPRDHQHAMELDRANGNTLWADAEAKE